MAENSKSKRRKSSKTAASEESVSYVLLKNGNKYKVTGETSRYYICGDRCFSPSSPYFDRICVETNEEANSNGNE